MSAEVKYVHTETAHNTKAAQKIVPIIMSLFNPKSVLDVGCGIGTWLHVFNNNNVTDVMGVDGDYVNRSLLNKYINEKFFTPTDLCSAFDLKRKFDIAICFEVAEHLPPESADIFIDSIAKHADVIIFSAAVPEQIGQNHLNEQWQSYWAAKFAALGYSAYDLIRPKVWNDADVDMWYKQNMLVFAKQPLPFPKAEYLDIIHPAFWEFKNKNIRTYERMLGRIKTGKAGISFYSKSLLKSVMRGGKKNNG